MDDQVVIGGGHAPVCSGWRAAMLGRVGNLDKAYASIHVGSRFRSTQDRTNRLWRENILFNPSLVQLPCLSPFLEVGPKD